MKVILLGTAAGGGYPQWNCACAMCARVGENCPPRSQDCVAVSADGGNWLLLNASPDIRSQIIGTPALAAGPGPRQTPIKAALLTDAELDHTLGLLMLREAAAGLRVFAPGAALRALRSGLPIQGITGAYGGWDWRIAGSGFETEGLRVRVLPVGDKRPKYARELDIEGPWVVAYRIEDPATGGVLVYAPCLATWPDGFDEFVTGASYALIDGTFYSPDEMAGATASGVSQGAQRRMGHIPMAGDDGSLGRLRRHPGVRWAYTHLNNTNPALDTTSAAYAEVRAAGADIPVDGTELTL
ncbi:MAG: pyrroloquinoline quinone biosynthesis protein PqqB [Actinophytocola sp.]|nr:pyrroloquinoline quinone biosynthesis protein PqqB [Actinophytocola sp.]